jgi:hypothetical protein
MPSPFPGMNPYLEQADVWTDFHQRYVVALSDALRAQLDPRYIVKIEEQLYVHEPPAPKRFLGRANVSAVATKKKRSKTAAAAVLEPPAEVELGDVDVERLSRVEIRDRAKRQLVSVLELLSPANKYAGPDREQYEAKRRQILSSPVQFVEIDLLRGERRMPMIAAPDCDYCVLVSRAEDRPKAGLWPWNLREPMPTVPVPVRAPDPDARLDLQALLHHCYDSAGYHTYLYQGSPSPALSRKDAAWARQIVRGARA